MLLYFKVKNYRSFRDEAILDMEAAALKDSQEVLLHYEKDQYLPVVSVFGKNGGGKSNLIRAMWLAVRFICNAQRTQLDKTPIPVKPFALDDYSQNEPTSFEFSYVKNGVKYLYGFSATRKEIQSEYLKCWPNGRESTIFTRDNQNFSFPKNSERKRKEMISIAVAPNQLFFAVSCAMNYTPCIEAMSWFREDIYFSRDYSDVNRSLIDYNKDDSMLEAIVSAARIADVGIEDIHFELENTPINIGEKSFPKEIEGFVNALRSFREALHLQGTEAEINLSAGKLQTTTYHNGINLNGEQTQYELSLSDESDGTRRLMSIMPAIKKTLDNGGLFIIDELEQELHFLLLRYVIDQYQQPDNNTNRAQLVFTTHEISLLAHNYLRRDQIYFADKNSVDGTSNLYSLADFNVRNDLNVQNAYLLGKFGAIPLIQEDH